MPTASKQFYNEQENIQVLREILNKIILRYTFSKPKDHDTTLETKLTEFLSISERHAYNAITMCHEFQNPITPLHQAIIYINNKEINSNIVLELNNANHTPNLREYLQQKYKWDSKTIQLIDWEVHNYAIKDFRSTQRKTLLQFIHKWLPTNSHPASTKPFTTLCTVCNISNETNDHFIECTHQHYRVTWEADIIIWYEKVTALQLEPILCYYIMLTLHNSKLFDSPNNIEFCEGNYKKLYLEQTTIGWQQVLYGRLTKTWVDIQNDYLHESTSKGLEIISTAITLLFKVILNRWKTRCHHQHGKCPQSNENLREHVLLPKVRQLYAASEQMSVNKRQYFNISITNIVQKPTKSLRQWITRSERFLHNTALPTIKKSTKTMQHITQVFQPRKRTTNPTTKQPTKHKQKNCRSSFSTQIDKHTSHDLTNSDLNPNKESIILNTLPKELQQSNDTTTTLATPQLSKKIIKRKSQSVRRRFTQAKRKNQPKRKKSLVISTNKQLIRPRPPPEPDPPNIEEELFNLLHKPP